MKANKLFKKLALSGVALGAAAVTLTATTFAWYTSNTSVEIEKLSGATEATAGSSDIYVAVPTAYANGGGIGQAVDTWGGFTNKVTPILATLDDANKTRSLKPVSYDGATSYKTLAGATASGENTGLDTPTYGTATSNDVYEYAIAFRTGTASDAATPLYFKEFNLTSAKATGAVDMVALASGGSTGIAGNGKYWADLLKALKVTTEGTGGVVTYSVSSEAADTTSAVYDLQALVDSTHTDVNIADNGANAVGYVNQVLSYALSKPQSYAGDGTAITKGAASQTDALAFTEIPTTGYVQVRFIFWLDGWDEYCYDVMRQQTFEFSFKATTAITEAVIHTA